jgi:hypothetical protein
VVTLGVEQKKGLFQLWPTPMAWMRECRRTASWTSLTLRGLDAGMPAGAVRVCMSTGEHGMRPCPHHAKDTVHCVHVRT